MPNFFAGIYLNGGASRNIIGLSLDGSGAGNRIAFNTEGVRLDDTNTVGNTIRGNEVFSNALLGIELGAPSSFGVTTNDMDDADAGPNNLQNYPVLTNTVVWGDATTLQGTLQSSSGVFIVDFYRNHAAGPFGVGQGQFHLGSLTVTTDVGGLAAFSYGVAGVFTGEFIAATATDFESGDTSEFGGSGVVTTNTTGPSMPVLTGFVVTNESDATVTVSLDAGWSHHLQISSNLEAWVDATGLISGATAVDVTEMVSTGTLRQFFRLVSP